MTEARRGLWGHGPTDTTEDGNGFCYIQPLQLSAAQDGGRRYDCVFVTAGRVKRRDGHPSNWVIAPEALAAAASKFGGVAVFVNHPGFFDSGRDVRDLVGVTEVDVRFVDDELRGTIRFYGQGAGLWVSALFDQILADRENGQEVPDVGLSAVFWHRTEIVDDDRVTIEFTRVESVDVVFGPGAKGAVRAALQAVDAGATSQVRFSQDAGAKPQGGKNMGDEKKTAQKPGGGGDGAPPTATGTMDAESLTDGVVTAAADALTDDGAGLEALATDLVAIVAEQEMTLQHTQEQFGQLLAAQCQMFLDVQLGALAAELPPVSVEHLRKQFSGRAFEPAELQAAIQEQRDLAAAFAEVHAVRDMGLREMQTGLDRFAAVVDWMFGVAGAPLPEPRFRRSDEIYVALTGDREFRGLYDAERVMLSGASPVTLPNLAVNAMNKVIAAQWAVLEVYRWYETVTSPVANDGSLHDMQWITYGGVGDLPTVSDGAAYTELDLDDVKESDAFEKHGGYIGVTRKMIKNSDLMRLQAVPQALAVAAVRTRSTNVADIFTSNSGVGPTLDQDSTALFHANHSNLATTSFGTDTAAWRAARTECFKHTEIGSSKRLGIFPRFCLVPPDLYDTALTVFGYGIGYPTSFVPEAEDRGPADPRPVIVTVPEFTDTNDWAYLVDPRIYPVIMISYSQQPGGGSHPLPELFAVVAETGGLMFTNDTMPIKVRDEWALGVNGYRGIGKRNVS